MNIRFSRLSKSFLFLSLCILMLPVSILFAPSGAQAANFGSLTDNGTAYFMGIGTNPHPVRPLYLLGNVCLFERQQNSAGFILHRSGVDVTGYNRWVFGADEPTGFVIKTYPYDGATAVEQLVITKDNPATGFNESRVGIGTSSPEYGSKLHVVSDTATDFARAVYGKTTSASGTTYGVYGEHQNGNYGALGSNNYGVYGNSSGNTGVFGTSSTGTGVWGSCGSGEGVLGESTSGKGVHGVGNGASSYGVYGTNGSNYGYLGDSSYGVYGRGNTGVYGTNGSGSDYGYLGASPYGVYGSGNTGVYGTNGSNYGYLGASSFAVYGNGTTGVYGTNGSNYGYLGDAGYGVYGKYGTDGPYGYLGGNIEGVYGRYGTSGPYGYLGSANDGVYGNSSVPSGIGVHGVGSGYGVQGEGGTNGVGVWGTSTNGYGVKGESTNSYAVQGRHGGTGPSGHIGSHDEGVLGRYSDAGPNGQLGTSSYGVVGTAGNGSHAGYFYGDVHVQGNLSASGTKPFVAADPADPTKEIWYVALEGPEAGTYIRGSAELKAGEAIIELPAHFAKVTVEKGLTVQLTPVGKWLQLYVLEKSNSRIVIAEANGKNGSFDYFINGIRSGYEDFQVVRDRPAGR